MVLFLAKCWRMSITLPSHRLARPDQDPSYEANLAASVYLTSQALFKQDLSPCKTNRVKEIVEPHDVPEGYDNSDEE